MLVLAVTLHNIPEGMAVGVVYAGCLTESSKSPPTAYCFSQPPQGTYLIRLKKASAKCIADAIYSAKAFIFILYIQAFIFPCTFFLTK